MSVDWKRAGLALGLFSLAFYVLRVALITLTNWEVIKWLQAAHFVYFPVTPSPFNLQSFAFGSVFFFALGYVMGGALALAWNYASKGKK